MLFFSLEMGHGELTQRILVAPRLGSIRQKMRTGHLTEQDWTKIAKALGRLEAPLWIDDNPNVTVMEIRAKARRLKSRVGDLGLIVVDYLQLMTGRGNAENRQVEVSEISRSLKILARELEVPIVALSQLVAQARDAGRQAADAVGPARIGLDRAGRRRGDVPLPRRGVQPRLARHGHRRDDRRQAPQRPDGHEAPGLHRHYTRFANMAKGM